jgi:hypothetical protein
VVYMKNIWCSWWFLASRWGTGVDKEWWGWLVAALPLYTWALSVRLTTHSLHVCVSCLQVAPLSMCRWSNWFSLPASARHGRLVLS